MLAVGRSIHSIGLLHSVTEMDLPGACWGGRSQTSIFHPPTAPYTLCKECTCILLGYSAELEYPSLKDSFLWQVWLQWTYIQRSIFYSAETIWFKASLGCCQWVYEHCPHTGIACTCDWTTVSISELISRKISAVFFSISSYNTGISQVCCIPILHQSTKTTWEKLFHPYYRNRRGTVVYVTLGLVVGLLLSGL